MKKKLCYISTSLVPSRTANSIHVMKMSNSFTKCALEVVLLAPDTEQTITLDVERTIYDYYGVNNEFRIAKYPYPKYLLGQSKGIFYSVICFFAVLQSKPDYVYGRNIIACCLSLMAGVTGGIEIHSPPSKFTRLERLVLKIALWARPNIHVTVISQALKSLCIAEGTLKAKNLHVHHDGADLPKCNSDTLELVGHEQQYCKNIGYIGHLYQGRGIDLILEVAKKLPRCGFHIVGGEQNDVEQWREVASKNVYFYGHVSSAETEAFRKSFDILLSPYQKSVSIAGKGDTSGYMSPLKIFEYMATGKLIISSDLPVLREVLNEFNSILVSPDDPNEWVEAIHWIINNPKEALEISREALKKFKTTYTWDIRARNIKSQLNAEN